MLRAWLNDLSVLYELINQHYQVNMRQKADYKSGPLSVLRPRRGHVLAELHLDRSLLALDAGGIFEQWVLTELYYRCRYHGRNYRLSTWRTASGAEVDAILETPKELIPIEIKRTDSPSRADARQWKHSWTLTN